MDDLPPQIQGALWTWDYATPDEDLLLQRFLARWDSWGEDTLLRALNATDDVPDPAHRSVEWPREDDLEREFAHFLSLYALGWLGTPHARDALAARLESPSLETCWASALALGLSRDSRAVGCLQRMLTEAYPVSQGDSVRQAPPATWSESIGSVIEAALEAPVSMPTRDDAAVSDLGYFDDRSGRRALAVALLAEWNLVASIPALRAALIGALAVENKSFQLGVFAFHGSWTGFYEPRLVYGLGELGAVGALTGVAGIEGTIPRNAGNMDTGTQGRLAMWRVHLALGSLHAHERLTSDTNTLQPPSLWAYSPQLRSEADQQLERLFGLEVAEREHDLEAYDHDLISTHIWQYHLNAKWRKRIAAALSRAG